MAKEKGALPKPHTPAEFDAQARRIADLADIPTIGAYSRGLVASEDPEARMARIQQETADANDRRSTYLGVRIGLMEENSRIRLSTFAGLYRQASMLDSTSTGPDSALPQLSPQERLVAERTRIGIIKTAFKELGEWSEQGGWKVSVDENTARRLKDAYDTSGTSEEEKAKAVSDEVKKIKKGE